MSIPNDHDVEDESVQLHIIIHYNEYDISNVVYHYYRFQRYISPIIHLSYLLGRNYLIRSIVLWA